VSSAAALLVGALGPGAVAAAALAAALPAVFGEGETGGIHTYVQPAPLCGLARGSGPTPFASWMAGRHES
jgi:hypothetical protein